MLDEKSIQKQNGQYNLISFTNNSIVICKIIVGGLASLFEGGGICEANDGGSVVLKEDTPPVTAFAVPAPSARGPRGAPQKRRKIYESYWHCQKSGRFGENRDSQGNQKNPPHP